MGHVVLTTDAKILDTCSVILGTGSLVYVSTWSSLVEGDEGSYQPIVKQVWLLSFMNCLYNLGVS